MTGVGGIPTERQTQRAILAMAKACFPDVLLHHSPNGAHLAGDAGPLLGDGMRQGFPDLIAIWDGGVAFMEVKRPFGPRGGGGGEISDPQRMMLALFGLLNHNATIVRSQEEAHAFLRDCGAPCRGELV